MAMLTILQFPDPRLRNKALPVEQVNDEVKTIVNDMIETMHKTPNTAGLAAIQLNIKKRIVVMDLSAEKNQPMVFINPELSQPSDETTTEVEGCLSVEMAAFNAAVKRPKTIRVDALDADGKPFSMHCDGFLARCIQHEVDHLNGILFVDYLSKLKRDRLKKWIDKRQRLNKS